MFNFIEEENKRLGYSYAREDEIPHHEGDGSVENYNMPAETKLRPLVNYDHQQELRDTLAENQELRDIG